MEETIRNALICRSYVANPRKHPSCPRLPSEKKKREAKERSQPVQKIQRKTEDGSLAQLADGSWSDSSRRLREVSASSAASSAASVARSGAWTLSGTEPRLPRRRIVSWTAASC